MSAAHRPATPCFRSAAVEAQLAEVATRIDDPALRRLFVQCYPNTLDTTVRHTPDDGGGQPDTFVITGDIHALWLRDSAAQVWPYLPLLRQDDALRRMVAGLVRRHARCLLLDPYANAFNDGPGHSEWASDQTDMRPELHERKWELDSPCYAIRLAHGYWRASGDASPFDAEWLAAMRAVLATLRQQQRKHDRGPYRFRRLTAWQSDTLPCDGWGNPLRPVGLIASMFRPSDDACVLPFLVPSNCFAVAALRQLAELVDALYREPGFAAECCALADEVDAAIRRHAIVRHPVHGEVFAFEVDGFGNALFMDDGNVPSLLSLPYLGYVAADDPVYRATRALALSHDNPWYFSDEARGLAGIGSPHTLAPMVWPMSLIMRALTSTDDAEIADCLRMLQASDAGTGLMHESFDVHDPARFTRAWFAWANTLFGELVVRLAGERPHLLRRGG
ncbi:glycoside hydrolase family 125 protein [Chitiniphilus shinanonensis]|uniref:glycoside hydrolase family 125 protein n=1 Tax=Chitiniphilus shinanonensis TaxID=553088 RepID=UPI00305C9390